MSTQTEPLLPCVGFLLDPTGTDHPAVVAWRRNLRGALDVHGVRPVQATGVAELVAAVGESPLAAVLCERVDALEELHQGSCGDNLWMVLFPDAPHDWPEGAEWVSLARDARPRVAGFVTDSQTSQDEIERSLSDQRVEVVVLPIGLPAPTARQSDPEPVPPPPVALRGLVELGEVATSTADARAWSFAAAKVLPPTAFAGELGGWEPGVPASPGVPQRQAVRADEQVLRRGVARLIPPVPRATEPVRAAVLGPQLTFIDQLAADLTRRGRVRVETDQWRYLSGPGGGNTRTPALLEAAEVVVAEWARPNAVWIQENARPEQRLVVRAHRYEVTTGFPRAIDMTRYDAGVVITPWVGRTLVQEHGWDPDKMVFIPNYVDAPHFRRPKLPGAEFTLGMVGIRPSLKRVDLALDLLAELRRTDARYTLRLRGALPPRRPHWDLDDVRRQWGRTLQRIEQDPDLRGAVHLDAEGRDMSRWYRHVGIILSLSDLEGSHVALAEGLASGAVPVARPWPGITTLWPAEIVTPTLAEAVTRVRSAQDPAVRAEWVAWGEKLGQLDGARVCSSWEALLRGELETARAHFGPVDWTVPPMTAVAATYADDPVPGRSWT